MSFNMYVIDTDVIFCNNKVLAQFYCMESARNNSISATFPWYVLSNGFFITRTPCDSDVEYLREHGFWIVATFLDGKNYIDNCNI